MVVHSIEDRAVIGAGRMGHGIAVTFALDDRRVNLFDTDGDVLDSSPERIGDALETLVETGHVPETEAQTACQNVVTTGDFEAAVSDVDFVIEAVVEDLEIKRTVFERLDEHTPGDTILGTNTSSLSIDDVADPVEKRSRVLGTHWFNIPHLVP